MTAKTPKTYLVAFVTTRILKAIGSFALSILAIGAAVWLSAFLLKTVIDIAQAGWNAG